MPLPIILSFVNQDRIVKVFTLATTEVHQRTACIGTVNSNGHARNMLKRKWIHAESSILYPFSISYISYPTMLPFLSIEYMLKTDSRYAIFHWTTNLHRYNKLGADWPWQHTLNDKQYRVEVSRICANQKAISIISKSDLRTPPPQRAAALKRQNFAVIASSWIDT